MKGSQNPQQSLDNTVGVYECELRLKFRIIEERLAMSDREDLINVLVDAFAYGSDDYLEAIQSEVDVQEIQDLKASPAMRRQLMRLRNSQKLA